VGRRRILLDVQPRVLRDALEQVLDSIGLDEVLVSDEEPADRSPMSFDAAILTIPASNIAADVVIELPSAASSTGHVTAGSSSEDVDLRSPTQLLDLLDRLCPASTPRNALFGGAHG
jgi:hypothetical protein